MKLTQLKYHLQDQIAWITLNRPEKLNALTPIMLQGCESDVRSHNGVRPWRNSDDRVRSIHVGGGPLRRALDEHVHARQTTAEINVSYDAGNLAGGLRHGGRSCQQKQQNQTQSGHPLEQGNDPCGNGARRSHMLDPIIASADGGKGTRKRRGAWWARSRHSFLCTLDGSGSKP